MPERLDERGHYHPRYVRGLALAYLVGGVVFGTVLGLLLGR